MDDQEIKLEEISDRVNNYTPSKHPPIFEMYATLFSILMAIMLFLFPDMLSPELGDAGDLYWILLSLMPQHMWALTFFVAGMIKAVGMLIDNDVTRIVGLVLSVLIYAVFAICYILGFPTIGAVIFVCMTIFTLISITMVKYTGIRDE